VGHRLRRVCVVSVMKLTLTIYTQNCVNIKKPSETIFNMSMLKMIQFVF